MEASGRNRTPDKLPAAERRELFIDVAAPAARPLQSAPETLAQPLLETNPLRGRGQGFFETGEQRAQLGPHRAVGVIEPGLFRLGQQRRLHQLAVKGRHQRLDAVADRRMRRGQQRHVLVFGIDGLQRQQQREQAARIVAGARGDHRAAAVGIQFIAALQAARSIAEAGLNLAR